MSESNERLEQDRQLIRDAKQSGVLATLGAYTRLSGPGWLQSAITLGGGSLAGGLYLGVIGGYQILWLQPLMMLLGVCMLSAIGYVALSTRERPFHAINRHINPVLGWGWAIATLMANLVWAMPQFSLGAAALQQNLMPDTLGGESGKYLAVGILFLTSSIVIWFYDQGGAGLRFFELILKAMVGVVVLSFMGVVVAMVATIPWSEVAAGFVPNLRMLFEPAERIKPFLADSAFSEFWRTELIATQRDLMVTAAATAVGINMTFLLPYSMLKRGWDRDFRGLATFDLFTGLLIPFILATTCVVLAAATQFHAQYDPGLVGESEASAVTEKLQKEYQSNLDKLLAFAHPDDFPKWTADEKATQRSELSLADRRIAAILIKRDAQTLALSLENLTGRAIAQYVFGIGVLGMALSTIIILMLINGFTICEMANLPSGGLWHRLGCMMPGVSGALGFLYLWSNQQANFWLAVPTSVFGMVLLPVAYFTFLLMINSKSLLGEHRPQGVRRLGVNAVLCLALAAASVGAGWSIWGRTQQIPGLPPGVQVRHAAIAIAVLFAVAAFFGRVREVAPVTEKK